VNRLAQKTDAGQLSRNLLLVPKAAVSVKPNLQIVADDVKCTHGCTVSDLSDEELFYFRARGVSYEQARQALVYSFGAEVVQQLKHEKLVGRIQDDVRACLRRAVAADA
jgi:Fe-S cluster assembly protein SufD